MKNRTVCISLVHRQGRNMQCVTEHALALATGKLTVYSGQVMFLNNFRPFDYEIEFESTLQLCSVIYCTRLVTEILLGLA